MDGGSGVRIWPEALQLPAALPGSGSLSIGAAAGRLSAVRALAGGVLALPNWDYSGPRAPELLRHDDARHVAQRRPQRQRGDGDGAACGFFGAAAEVARIERAEQFELDERLPLIRYVQMWCARLLAVRARPARRHGEPQT